MAKLIVGINDLATVNPDVAAAWDYEKNGEFMPDMFTSASGMKVWWKDERGHEWLASIANRTKNKTGCPFCANKKVLPGENDLATMRPELVEEWNYAKNGNLTPDMFTAGSNKKAWWICKADGHEWTATIDHRVKGSGCPVCAGRKGSVKESKE